MKREVQVTAASFASHANSRTGHFSLIPASLRRHRIGRDFPRRVCRRSLNKGRPQGDFQERCAVAT
jgi:hypothetical protein